MALQPPVLHSQAQLGPEAPTSKPSLDLKALLAAHLEEDPLESLFHGCVKRVLIPDRSRQGDLPNTLRSFFSASPPEQLPLYVEQYVLYMTEQNNVERVGKLMEILHSLVAMGTLRSKLVCEVLLKLIDTVNAVVWCKSLELVRNIVGGVDYKGCRDLMKLLIEKFIRLPPRVPRQQLPVLLKGKELLEYMLDRNASLMPAYFAYDEIQRHYLDKNHWILQEVIGQLHSSMKATADMVSGIVQPHLYPVMGVSNVSVSMSVWRLDPARHYCCVLKGLLPYREALLRPRNDLLYHVVAQPYSRDAVHSVLGMNRQQMQPSGMVEDALVQLCLVAMETTESLSDGDQQVFEVWSHFASQLVFFYFMQLVNIPSLFSKLRTKLLQTRCRRGRGWLMWSLLHYSTSTIFSKAGQANAVLQKEFVPILNLFTLLYQDKEPLPLPDPTNPLMVYKASMASMWIIYASKAKADNMELPRPMPYMLSKQIDWIQQQSEAPPPPSATPTDFTIPLLLNIYSNNAEVSGRLLNILMESLVSPSPDIPPSSIPLPALNALAMHAKIRLMERVKVHLIKVAESAKQPQSLEGPSPVLTPAILETYSRLLVWLGTKNFQTQLIPAVFKSQAWPVLHALIEIIAYRVHLQLQFSSRFQFLQQFYTVASVSIIPHQLFISAESAALRLIRGLNSPEFLIQVAKQFTADPKQLLSPESEELNRVLVLVVAQALHISNMDTSNWLEPFLKAILSAAPHSWPESSLAFFPMPLRQLCSVSNTMDARFSLLSRVEEEYKKFKSKTNELELVQIFTETDSATVFLCVLWKLLLETGTVSSVCIKIVQRTQPKKLAGYLRKMVDFVIFTLPPLESSPNQLNSVILRLSELVWKYCICPLDRLILCMLFRGHNGREAHVCLTLAHYLLLGNQELSQRINTFVKEVPVDHWTHPNWDKHHTAYLKQFPESFQPDVAGLGSSSRPATMPMYFGNVCLRLLPVLDLLIQRFLEVPEIAKQTLDKLLDVCGPLYKFHDHPISFLYTTLHYYERTLAERPAWKKRLIATVIGAKQSVHPLNWYFTLEFSEYLTSSEGPSWSPPQHYYSRVIERLEKGLRPFSPSLAACDWRFSEFSSSLPSVLYCCCVELLALPLSWRTVARELLEAIYSRAAASKENEEVLSWINALALALVFLPDTFRLLLLEEILQMLRSLPSVPLPSLYTLPGNRPGCLLSLVHAYWHHANMGVLVSLPQWMQASLRPLVQKEAQLLLVCHLLGPLLLRLTNEKPKVLLEVVMEIYYMLQSVDQHQGGHMEHSDIICDFLYHIKYMHIGDQKKEEIEKVVSSLHVPLRLRLRFLVPSLLDRHIQQQTPLGFAAPQTTVPKFSGGESMQM